MTQTSAKNVLVAGTLKSIADGGIVAYASDIYDRNLQMTQSEINTFDGGIEKEYGWKVVNTTEYNLIAHLPKVLYFLVDDSQPIESDTKLEGTTILTNFILSSTTLDVTGTFENNTITF